MAFRLPCVMVRPWLKRRWDSPVPEVIREGGRACLVSESAGAGYPAGFIRHQIEGIVRKREYA